MNVLLILLGFIGFFLFLYIGGFFVGSRIFIPHMGFRKENITDVPTSIKRMITHFKKRAHDRKAYFYAVCTFLTRHFHGEKRRVWKEFSLLFKDIRYLWKKKGFLPCTQFCHLLRIFLVKSGLFREEDIKIHHMFHSFSIHQYLLVRVDKRWMPVDLWAYRYGVPIGKKLDYF